MSFSQPLKNFQISRFPDISTVPMVFVLVLSDYDMLWDWQHRVYIFPDIWKSGVLWHDNHWFFGVFCSLASSTWWIFPLVRGYERKLGYGIWPPGMSRARVFFRNNGKPLGTLIPSKPLVENLRGPQIGALSSFAFFQFAFLVGSCRPRFFGAASTWHAGNQEVFGGRLFLDSTVFHVAGSPTIIWSSA